MSSLLHPRTSDIAIELVDFVAVPYPRVNRFLRHRLPELFGAGDAGAAKTELGVPLGQLRLAVDVMTRVVDVADSRFPIPGCTVTLECVPVRGGRYMKGMSAAITAYPVRRASSVLWMAGTYRPVPGRSPDRLFARRVVRAFVEDMFDGLVETIRTHCEVGPRQGTVASPMPLVARLSGSAWADIEPATGDRLAGPAETVPPRTGRVLTRA